jgi:hypothetical protein
MKAVVFLELLRDITTCQCNYMKLECIFLVTILCFQTVK